MNDSPNAAVFHFVPFCWCLILASTVLRLILKRTKTSIVAQNLLDLFTKFVVYILIGISMVYAAYWVGFRFSGLFEKKDDKACLQYTRRGTHGPPLKIFQVVSKEQETQIFEDRHYFKALAYQFEFNEFFVIGGFNLIKDRGIPGELFYDNVPNMLIINEWINSPNSLSDYMRGLVFPGSQNKKRSKFMTVLLNPKIVGGTDMEKVPDLKELEVESINSMNEYEGYTYYARANVQVQAVRVSLTWDGKVFDYVPDPSMYIFDGDVGWGIQQYLKEVDIIRMNYNRNFRDSGEYADLEFGQKEEDEENEEVGILDKIDVNDLVKLLNELKNI